MPDTDLTTHWHQADLQFKEDRFPEHSVASAIAPRLDRLEEGGSVSGWWFMRKPPGCRVRLYEADTEVVEQILNDLTAEGTIAGWKSAIYEPETIAFGGTAGMDITHTLFCADTRGVLGYFRHDSPPVGRRELSVLLISAMLAAAGLDWFERGDVFARIAALRPGPPSDGDAQKELTGQFRTLLADTALGPSPMFAPDGPAGFAASWMTAFEVAGRRFADVNEQGTLHRGLRTVLAQVVIFHWNRLGLGGIAAQRLVAHAVTDVYLPRD